MLMKMHETLNLVLVRPQHWLKVVRDESFLKANLGLATFCVIF
jgi:hypothetical protein